MSDGANIATIGGHKVDLTTNMVINDTKPKHQRMYRGSELPNDIKCFDVATGRYINTELFQPTIYDLECQRPLWNPKWDVYDKPNAKSKKKIGIKPSKAYLEWYHEQKRRCLYGYEVGGVKLSGLNYFALNFYKIRGKAKGSGYINLKFLDYQKLFFDRIEEAKKRNKNYLGLKRRQIGFSELGAIMAAYDYTFFEASQSLIVGGEGGYAITTFKKVKNALDFFAPEKGGDEFFYKRKLKDSMEDSTAYIRSGYMHNGIEMGMLSEIEAITTKDNIQKANGRTPSFTWLEEFGINSEGLGVYEMILPALMEQGLLNGNIMCVIGTGGDMEAGAAGMMDMFYNPDNYNLLADEYDWNGDGVMQRTADFYPAWYFYIMDNDGNSYKEAGLEMIHNERAKKKGDSIQNYKTQMPITPDDAFTIGGNSPFDSEKLNKAKKACISNGGLKIHQRGRLEWIYDMTKYEEYKGKKIFERIGVEWIPAPPGKEKEIDEEGDLKYPIIIIEHPEHVSDDFKVVKDSNIIHNLYFAGMDPINKSNTTSSKSKASYSVFKDYLDSNTTSKLFAARLTWKPKKKEKFYEMTARLNYYFGCKVLIEWSNDSPLDWYKNNGYAYQLKERPVLTYAKYANSKVENKYGIDPNTKSVWIEHYASYIMDYWYNMHDLEQIIKALEYRLKKDNKKFNCDITDSSMLAYENAMDSNSQRYEAVERNKIKSSQGPLMGYVKSRNGISKI